MTVAKLFAAVIPAIAAFPVNEKSHSMNREPGDPESIWPKVFRWIGRASDRVPQTFPGRSFLELWVDSDVAATLAN